MSIVQAPISHQEIIERIEWPLLDCIQEFHFGYSPYGCDVADYRVRFANELSHKRGQMHQLDRNDLKFLPLMSDGELLSRAPSYRVLLPLLSAVQPGFGAAARFAAALMLEAKFSPPPNEEIFALIAVGHDGNDRVALGLTNEANSLLAQAGLRKIAYLFLVAAETQSRTHDGHKEEFTKELDRFEQDYLQYPCIAETFEFSKTIRVPHAVRSKELCKTMIVRVPAG
jgi:hypothetical protein